MLKFQCVVLAFEGSHSCSCCVSSLRFFPTSSQRASYSGNGKLHHDIRCSAAKLWCLCCRGPTLPVLTGSAGVCALVQAGICFDRSRFACIIIACTPLRPSLISLLSLSFLASTDAPELSAAASEARHQHSASCPYHSNTGPKRHHWPWHGRPATSPAQSTHPAEDSLWQGGSAFLYLQMQSTAKCTLIKEHGSGQALFKHFVAQCLE